MPSVARKITVVAILAILVAASAATGAKRKMEVTKLGTNLCQTTFGGRFVEIKRFPGEYVDRRLRRDVRFLARKYDIFVTDGYSKDGVHSINGEHPLGLALDIVPNFAAGGTWKDINRLARWAEPQQDQPRPPFRWVGYNGDPGHGRGHHLHLSWNHNRKTTPFKPVRKVFSIRCPKPGSPAPEPSPEPSPEEGASGGETSGGASPQMLRKRSSGGVRAGTARSSRETGGVSYRNR